MRIFRPSLAEDFVDRYNHIWAVLLLLFAALVTWLLPFTPQLQTQAAGVQGEIEPRAAAKSSFHHRLLKFKAFCWCPSDYTEPMVEYTHTICENAFNHFMQGGNLTDTKVTFYNMPPFVRGYPTDFDLNFNPNILRPEKKVPKEEKRTVEAINLQEHNENVLHFMQKVSPFYLLLLAAWLKIPHFMWLLLCSLTNIVNIDKVLASAKRGSKLDHRSRHQLYSELAVAVAETVRASPCKASTLYLLLKITMCVVAIGETCIVYTVLLPRAREVVSLSQAAADVAMNDNNILKETLRQESNDDRFNDAMMYTDRLLFCVFKVIHKLPDDISTHEPQCLFSAGISSEMSHLSRQRISASELSRHFSQAPAHAMYESLYLILFTCLSFLAVVNCVSFVAWITRLLVRPCQAYVDPDSDLPLDGHLLLQMAKENVGVEVVTGLLQAGALAESKRMAFLKTTR